MKKWLLRGILAVGVLLIVIVVVVLLSLDSLVRAGVETGGTYATGQKTTLDTASLSLMGGSLQLNGLDIRNPQGYTTSSLIKLKETKVKVQSGSLFSDTVIVDEILIDGMEVTLEQQGIKNNLGEVLDVIKKQTAAAGGAPQSGNSDPSGKKLKIGIIKCTNTKVTVKAGVGMTFTIPEISIKDPTNPDGRPMKIADVVGKVLIAVAKSIAENPQLPGDLKGGLDNVMKGVQDIGKQMEGGIKDLGKGLGDIFKKPEQK